MGKRITCFFLKPGNTAEESFRRYAATEEKCSGGKFSYHNASVILGEVPWEASYHGCGDIPSAELKADPRWPAACPCGYVFKPEDSWQHNMRRFFVDDAGQHKYTLDAAPPGAMWNADWMHRWDRTTGDGIWLCVRLPDGVDWLVDGPSRAPDGSHGPGWTRTGVPPTVTARPSILTDGYHGFLTDGVLEEC